MTDAPLPPAERVPVAVLDPVPAYRAGLLAALPATQFHALDEPVEQVLDQAGRRALLVTVRSDDGWETVDRYGHHCPTTVVVALLLDASPAGYRDAFRAGACSAAPFDAPVDTIVSVLHAALDAHALLPTELAQALASGDGDRTEGWITDKEAEWLRLLQTGMTIARLAERVGYSERSLYRLLHDLYGRMQVSNRTEAIAKASRLGVLDA